MAKAATPNERHPTLSHLSARSVHALSSPSRASVQDDPIFRQGIETIRAPDPTLPPDQYQNNSSRLLTQFFVLLADPVSPRSLLDSPDKSEGPIYVFKLTNLYLDRVESLPCDSRQDARWLIGRCLAFQARFIGTGAGGEEGKKLVRRAEETLTRVVGMVGKVKNSKGEMKLRPDSGDGSKGGDSDRERIWKSWLDEVLGHIKGLLPLPTSKPYPRQIVRLLPFSDSSDASADPFANLAEATTGPEMVMTSSFRISTLLQHRSLLLALLAFSTSILYPTGSSLSQHAHQPVFPWVTSKRQHLQRTLVETWPPVNARAAPAGEDTAEGGGEGSVLEADYLRLARLVGATSIGVWPKVVEVVKRRVEEEAEMAKEFAGKMDVEEVEDEAVRQRKARNATRRQEIDGELKTTLGGEGDGRGSDLDLGDWHREEVMNGTLGVKALVDFVLDWEGEGNLSKAIISLLSLLPSSLPQLQPVANLLASHSSSSADANATPTQTPSRKRKRDFDARNWTTTAISLMAKCFPPAAGDAQPESFQVELSEDESVSPTSQTRKRVLMAFVGALEKADFPNASAAQISSFAATFALSLILLTTVIKPEPPTFPTSASNLSKSRLLDMTIDCRTIPAGVVAAACKVYKPALPTKVKKTLLDGMVLMLERLFAIETEVTWLESRWTTMVGLALRDKDRSVRLAAGRFLISLAQAPIMPGVSVFKRIEGPYKQLTNVLGRGSVQARETALSTLSSLIEEVDDGLVFEKVLSQLVMQLGESDTWLKAAAPTTILALAKRHNKTPYRLFLPYFKAISIRLTESFTTNSAMLYDFASLVKETPENFLCTTLVYTIPHLVANQRLSVLVAISKTLQLPLSTILVDHLPKTLFHIFMQDAQQTDKGFDFLLQHLQPELSGRNKSSKEAVSTSTVLKLIVPGDLLYLIVTELGDTNPAIKARAEAALTKAEIKFREAGQSEAHDIGDFLHPYMLGIIWNVNELLQGAEGKKPVEEKIKVIRSLDALIRRIGVTMATFSQQIMVTLQGNLGKEPLRLISLETWHTFVSMLRFRDISPHVGPTTAAFVTYWSKFTPEERAVAAKTINYLILENADSIKEVLNDIVSLDGIAELRKAAQRLRDARQSWDDEKLTRNLLRRAEDDNTIISFRSLQELKLLLLKQGVLSKFASGDSFNPIVGELIRTLLRSTARDGEADDVEDLRDVSLECLGIVGALDPDRFSAKTMEESARITDNLSTYDDASCFAIHLMENLLVSAFRATNDTRYQESLAYTIQELNQFCGFTKDLVDSSNKRPRPSIFSKVREKWNKIQATKQTVLADMLTTKYSIKTTDHKPSEQLPIYPLCPTYREWIQKWTSDLIFKTKGEYAEQIFTVFRAVVRNQDVHVARYLLPYLIINHCTNGDKARQDEVIDEIRTVLEDQVNPTANSSPDRRLLSAQTVFDLMDHISRWIRLRHELNSRLKKEHSRSHPRSAPPSPALEAALSQVAAVERVISSIDSRLTAQAALQCKAYARSLLNFEKRIHELRDSNAADAKGELQSHYEHIHEIYAALDEPDGMEGVSTMVLLPSLEHQIREHESIGRWTSAQSCWEVQIQESQDDLSLHLGLLRCLRNLGHYDTLRTHIRGLVSRRPEWETSLSSFQVEGAWMVGDWTGVKSILARTELTSPELSLARVLVSVESNDPALPSHLRSARMELGRPLISATRDAYQRSYDSVVQLHLLHELELITEASHKPFEGVNGKVLSKEYAKGLKNALAERLGRTLPSFRVQEPILSMRRTAFGLTQTTFIDSKSEVGQAWLLSSKNARKAGHLQTAYSAVLQARQIQAPFAFVQGAKLLASTGEGLRALQELQHPLDPLLIDPPQDQQSGSRVSRVAKAALLKARWMRDADRFESNQVIASFRAAISLNKEWEAPLYHLGNFYDKQAANTTRSKISIQFQQMTVENYALALEYGTKYIYRTMPRMLTIFLDCSARQDMLNDEARSQRKESTKYEEFRSVEKMIKSLDKAVKRLPKYQWLTALPQVVSRIGHQGSNAAAIIQRIMVGVLEAYPLQAIWSMMSVSQSTKPERVKRAERVFSKAKPQPGSGVEDMAVFVQQALSMARELIVLANVVVVKEISTLSMQKRFPKLKDLAPSPLIVPLEDQLTVTLPHDCSSKGDHRPFSTNLVRFAKFNDEVDVMSSLVRPKKISLMGDNGQKYNLLCKPTDDLRKDARVMDFNGMINKLLKSDSESRRRNLYIRTYAVVPLNEETGLLQWVNHTTPWRPVLAKYMAARGQNVYSPDIAELYESWKTMQDAEVHNAFTNVLLPRFKPVWHQWFMETFPEPSAWLAARLNYGRTYAVMSMIGFVLGLGDRHCENTLYDSNNGDTVHVDLNCLFEKGRGFLVPEKIPFRLTQNIVDGLGVSGVEGVYRKACEITMRVLRQNKDSLMSVLEAFIHDPLVEWQNDKAKTDKMMRNKSRSSTTRDGGQPVETSIDAIGSVALDLIERKLRGVRAAYIPKGVPEPTKEISVGNQVEALIQEATNPVNLAKMYVGWSSYL